MQPPSSQIKGRGAVSSPVGRFEPRHSESTDDGWQRSDDTEQTTSKAPKTVVRWHNARSMVNTNDSPDIPHNQSVNPYRGCEHGCIYCFARPSHAYLNLSPGLDFETKVFAKRNASAALRKDLAKPGYVPQTIAFGINTDAYQPAEKRYRITRQLLEVLLECRHPVSLLTKSTLIERDLDLLTEMARLHLVSVGVSITTLDRNLSNSMEPRAADPKRRLHIVRTLSDAGIPTSVMMAPIIPAINDNEIESLLCEAAQAGAKRAGYIVLRLPHELKDVFKDWLYVHFPSRAQKVLNQLAAIHGDKLYNAQFFRRQRGVGVYAELIRTRFERAKRKYFGSNPSRPLRTDLFVPPGGKQESLL